MSSLNEAKSAFGRFHFDCGFFERCEGGAASASSARSNDGRDNGDESEEEYSSRYICRVPVRSVHSVLKARKGVISLRIRSEGMDGDGNYFGLNTKRMKKKGKRGAGSGARNHSGEGEEEREERDLPYSVRRARKRRKNDKSKYSNADGNNNANASSITHSTDKMMLSFEYHIERPSKSLNQLNNPSNNAPGIFKVVHKIGVTDANGITLSASTQRKTRSEIVSPPKLWLRLLDPLRRTQEVALTIDDELKVVTATTFHAGEMVGAGGGGGGPGGEENAVLQAAAARNALLKTETSTNVDEFDEYDFRNNRGKKRKNSNNANRRGDSDGSGRSDDEAEFDFEKESDRPPMDVNEKVILVFSIKEAKAMLQFCSQTNSTYHDDGDALSILSFHWGGRPIVIETDGDNFTAELVLATLHHGMIASNISVGGGVGERRASDGERD